MVERGRKRSSSVLLHAISTNGLEDLFPQNRASPPGSRTSASKFIWLWQFTDTRSPPPLGTASSQLPKKIKTDHPVGQWPSGHTAGCKTQKLCKIRQWPKSRPHYSTASLSPPNLSTGRKQRYIGFRGQESHPDSTQSLHSFRVPIGSSRIKGCMAKSQSPNQF